MIRYRFDSQNICSSFLSQLHRKKQGEKEARGHFLQQKYMLYQSVYPDDPEKVTITTLVNLLTSTLRRCMSAHESQDFSELLSKILDAEWDEKEENQILETKPKKERTKTKDKSINGDRWIYRYTSPTIKNGNQQHGLWIKQSPRDPC